MSIRYTHSRVLGVDRYDAKVGPFYVGASDNGEGWFHWWVALAEQGPAEIGDRFAVDNGGASSWSNAQIQIVNVLHSIMSKMRSAMNAK